MATLPDFVVPPDPETWIHAPATCHQIHTRDVPFPPPQEPGPPSLLPTLSGGIAIDWVAPPLNVQSGHSKILHSTPRIELCCDGTTP